MIWCEICSTFVFNLNFCLFFWSLWMFCCSSKTYLDIFSVACQLDFIGFVIHNDILWAGKIIFNITIIVFNMDTDIVSWDDFLEQNISAVSLESIILSIKGFVMRVTPAVASTCCFRKTFKTRLNIMQLNNINMCIFYITIGNNINNIPISLSIVQTHMDTHTWSSSHCYNTLSQVEVHWHSKVWLHLLSHTVKGLS